MEMNVEAFLAMLLAFSTLSSLVTEALKKLMGKAPSNVLAACTALIVGTAGTLVYMALSNIPINAVGITWGILMGIACGLCSMLGYDKVKQAITQMKEVGSDGVDESKAE